MGIRVRFAPSPTGDLHIGGVRTALFNYLYAKKEKGTFILRIEDTDNKREVEGAVETVINAMDYFGVHFDEGAAAEGDNGKYGPYRQRQRKDIYHVFAKLLTEQGLAYPCFMTAEEIEAEVKRIIAEVGATSLKEMGKVMGTASKQLAGKADGRVISEVVKKLLA